MITDSYLQPIKFVDLESYIWKDRDIILGDRRVKVFSTSAYPSVYKITFPVTVDQFKLGMFVQFVRYFYHIKSDAKMVKTETEILITENYTASVKAGLFPTIKKAK